MSAYAAKVEDDGTVSQVIVGDATWAADRLGGVWVGSDAKVGVGWQVVDGTLVPPPSVSVEQYEGEVPQS